MKADDGADAATAETLLAALQAGAITKAAYAARAREAGVAASVVAAHLRAAPAQDGVAAVAAEKERLERQAAEEAQASSQAAAAPPPPAGDAAATGSSSSLAGGAVDLSSDDPVAASLAWLSTQQRRSARWGARAAERLSAANDFLFDLEFVDQCGIDDEACTHIAMCLRANSTLTSVDFSGGSNQITDAGCAALCDALHANTSVTMLSLADNHIGDAGCAALAALLATASPLVELDVQRNAAVTDAGKSALRAAWASGGGAGDSARAAERLHL